jgi:hypothetical protein
MMEDIRGYEIDLEELDDAPPEREAAAAEDELPFEIPRD